MLDILQMNKIKFNKKYDFVDDTYDYTKYYE